MALNQTVSDVRRGVLSRLTNVRERESYWVALCPSHDDHNPSLSIQEKEDGVSVKCHAGCATEAILEALGMEKKDLYPQSQLEVSLASKRSEYYYYADERGEPLFRVWRTPSKTFIQQRWDRDSGVYRSGLGNVKPVLYRLPALLEASPTRPVFVVEGEKDVDRLISEGLVATTSPMGAGKWKDEYAGYLQGREVYVIPDNDEPGEKHACQVADSISGEASAKILHLPDLPSKGDVSDWLDAGREVRDLLALAQVESQPSEASEGPSEAPSTNGHHKGILSTFTLRELLDKDFPPVKWIIPDMLPEGTMLLAGKPKMGKSWLALSLCIAVATGGRALGAFDVEEGDVLYLALEDNERRLQDRAREIIGTEHGERLHFSTASPRLDQNLLLGLEEWLEEHEEARLIVIDTLARVRARTSDKRSLYEQDYEVGAELTTMAGRYNVAIVLIHHLKKGDETDVLDLVSGSTGLTGGVDGSMILTRTRSAADAVLKAVHRDLRDDPEMALSWNTAGERWTYIGDAEEYRMGKERREIFDVMAREDEPMKPSEVAEILGKPTDNVRFLMGKMLEEGLLDRPGEYGKYAIGKNAERPATLHTTSSTSSTSASTSSIDTTRSTRSSRSGVPGEEETVWFE